MMVSLLNKLRYHWARRNSSAYIAYLRSAGISIGKNVKIFGNMQYAGIDTTRPSLVKIGDNVQIVSPFTLLTHGFEWSVFRIKYNEVLGSAGRVVIGNNVYIGRDSCILKGVTIGDNVIIGAKSLVNKDIPSNSVAAGVPAKKIFDLDEYLEKRKTEHVQEAKEYAYSIYEVFKRLPREEDFFEFFPLFLKRDERAIAEFDKRLAIKMKRDKRQPRSLQKQLGPAFEKFMNSHPRYESFADFLRDAGIPEEEIKKS